MGRWRRCSGQLVCCVEGGAAPNQMVSEAPGDQMQTGASSAARVPESPRLAGSSWGGLGLAPLLHRRRRTRGRTREAFGPPCTGDSWLGRGDPRPRVRHDQLRPAEPLRGDRAKLRAVETTARSQGDGVLSAVGFCTLALAPGGSLISKNPGPVSLKEALFCV